MPAIDPAGRMITYCKTDHWNPVRLVLYPKSQNTNFDSIHEVGLERSQNGMKRTTGDMVPLWAGISNNKTKITVNDSGSTPEEQRNLRV